MTQDLWNLNHPSLFWRCQPDPAPQDWQAAIRSALPVLKIHSCPETIEDALALTLGEGQFGPHHWRLKPLLRLYYNLKPLIPRPFAYQLRRMQQQFALLQSPLAWPIEDRFVRFQWEVMRQLLIFTHQTDLSFTHFWPDGLRYALVLTHDIETAAGQKDVGRIADLEQQLGFRSAFNFVPERYPLDRGLIKDLSDRGFEIGIHGLKHDGKLYSSRQQFMERASRINHYLKEFGAVGFRSPLMHRQPVWMQTLDVEYDMSFFDTDPYEPMPGGCMSIWPFMIGHFVELPYTLTQDSTLVNILRETTPRLWLSKVEYLASYYGMALLNTHPDYLDLGGLRDIYSRFLQVSKEQGGYWHALPREVARWWRLRTQIAANPGEARITCGTITLDGDAIVIS